MVIVNLKKWQPITGLDHISTTWQMSTDPNKYDPDTMIEESVKNTGALETFVFDSEIPVGLTYYVRAKRHFTIDGVENDIADYWTESIPVTNIEKEYGEMIIGQDVYVEEPYIFLSDKDISNSKSITIRTSKYRANGGNHKATHWVVKDSLGKILYCNLYDEEHLTELELTITDDIRARSVLYFQAVHVSTSGSESKFGEYYIDVAEGLNFELVYPITNIPAETDYTIKLQKINPRMDTGLQRIDLEDYGTGHSVVTLQKLSDTEYQIPWYLLTPGTIYALAFYVYDSNSIFKKVTRRLTVEHYRDMDIINRDYKPKDELTELTDIDPQLRVVSGTYNVQQHTGDIPMPTGEADRSYKVLSVTHNRGIFYVKKLIGGLAAANDDTTGSLSALISKGLFLVDAKSPTGVTMFVLAKYNEELNAYALYSNLGGERNDEDSSLGITGNIVRCTDNSFLYIPIGQNKLKKVSWEGIQLNIETIQDDVLDNGGDKLWIAGLDHNQFLIGGGTNSQTKIYNASTNQFRSGPSLTPATFVDADLYAVRLNNGDTLLCKRFNNPDDTDSHILRIEYDTGKIIDTGIRYPNEKFFVDAVVISNIGYTYLSRVIPEDVTEGTPEEFLMCKYE